MRGTMNMQDTMIESDYREKIIIEKIRTLSPDKVAEVINFIDFLSQRYEESQLVNASNALSEKAFQEVWKNPEADVYDNL